MTIAGEQRSARSLILDPDLGPVELHDGEVTTVTSVFGSDESSPWRASRPVRDRAPAAGENAAVAP
ncbi:hypothetical protein ACFV24_09560 [Nocardia fluminea]|uniref:hypothetical protein n=2 Tax=Nocardia fluminea TaxID=134984 RepID=UPI000C703169|nr:hypothetical protein [Nocardia fluminea]